MLREDEIPPRIARADRLCLRLRANSRHEAVSTATSQLVLSVRLRVPVTPW